MVFTKFQHPPLSALTYDMNKPSPNFCIRISYIHCLASFSVHFVCIILCSDTYTIWYMFHFLTHTVPLSHLRDTFSILNSCRHFFVLLNLSSSCRFTFSLKIFLSYVPLFTFWTSIFSVKVKQPNILVSSYTVLHSIFFYPTNV